VTALLLFSPRGFYSDSAPINPALILVQYIFEIFLPNFFLNPVWHAWKHGRTAASIITVTYMLELRLIDFRAT
jgi:hypothetical protein